MLIESSFESAAPPERVWATLLDVERVAPCMPGAQLTEVVDERTWKGKVTIKIGPVSLSYSGTVVLQERDEAVHRVVLAAKGTEARGKGTASANVSSTVSPREGGGTTVAIEMDLTITGAAAQYGRGMITDVSQRLTREFANCLEQLFVVPEVPEEGAEAAPSGEPGASAAPAAPPVAPREVGGIRLGVWALSRALLRGLERLLAKVTGSRGQKPAP
ncbi:MAG TPA: SRPBCC family protein [Acidimicrobiales bacterium]|nr:SRPBCC family protein [Acidimicrobiales bacterium]